MKRLAVLLSGRGSNMEAVVRHTRERGVLHGVAEVVVVASNLPDAKGVDIARSMGVATRVVPHLGRLRSEFEAELVRQLDPFQPDLIVLAGFMRKLSPLFVGHFAHRIVNIHPADTRQHQGLHGYQWAFERKLPETFITVHYVDEGLDTGAIIGQCPVPIADAGSLEEVERRGLAVEHRFYSEMIKVALTRVPVDNASKNKG